MSVNPFFYFGRIFHLGQGRVGLLPLETRYHSAAAFSSRNHLRRSFAGLPPLGLSHQFEILSGLYSCLVRRRVISFLLEVIEPSPQHAPYYFSPADLETAGYGVQAVE